MAGRVPQFANRDMIKYPSQYDDREAPFKVLAGSKIVDRVFINEIMN